MAAVLTLDPSDFTVLCEVIAFVARQSGLSPEDAEDFSQSAHLTLLERNYAPVAMFAGRSSLRTYLLIVVRRLLLDWRDSRYGRWRPSASARRLGPDAVALDRLISRDGHSIDEAVTILESRDEATSPDALRRVADRLPQRSRVRTISIDDLQIPIACCFEDPIEVAEDTAAYQRELSLLREAYERLRPADRRLLYLRFHDRLTIAAIACLLGVSAKPLYRRIERLLKALRRELVSTGAFGRHRAPGAKSRSATKPSGVH